MTVKELIANMYTRKRRKNPIDPNEALRGAEKLAAKAKDGTLKIAGIGTFTFKFDERRWVYNVLGPNGEEFTTYNTKQLTVARK